MKQFLFFPTDPHKPTVLTAPTVIAKLTTTPTVPTTSATIAKATVTLPNCGDGVMNGNETDQDCGGGTCPKCQNGLKCQQRNDCVSDVCTGGFCQ
ncbi:unnamed protein product, partial [Rotaria sp. Silwood1]